MNTRKLLGNIAVTCFIIVQLTDWLATYQGLIRFGTEIEANPFLRFLMERYDIVFALTSAKIAATVAGRMARMRGGLYTGVGVRIGDAVESQA